MAIIARDGGGDFTPAPEGLHEAVCVDVVDLGMVESQWGTKPKVRIVWQIDARDEKGRRFQVVRQFTISLNEKSALRPFLEAWRGRKFTADELDGFDLEKLIGVGCQVQVVHDISAQGKTWANVQAVVPLSKSAVKMAPEDYVRVCDRPKDQHTGAAAGTGASDGEDVPF